MTQLLAAALPIVPGQEERVENLAQDIEALREEFLELNEKATLVRWAVFVQRTPMGSFAVNVLEAEDLSRVPRVFGDTPYDQWWVRYLQEVHGVSKEQVENFDPPTLAFLWERKS